MARHSAPADISSMFSLRVGRISPLMKTEDLLEDLATCGEIGDFYRPTNMDTLLPSPFAFVRYKDKQSADRAIEHFDGKFQGDQKLTVQDASMQNSFFTQDTGFITNAMFDTPQSGAKEFDGTLPQRHFEIQKERQLALADATFCIRVDDIPTFITKEEFAEICKEIGEVSTIYFPINLKTFTPRGFALVRYIRKQDAVEALKFMNNASLDPDNGRCLHAKWHIAKEYMSQNENPKIVDGLAYNKYADILPGFR
jgi:RNA recognition motif-containing protein